MSSWLLVSIGVAAGLVIVSGAIYVAARLDRPRELAKRSTAEVSARDDVADASHLAGCDRLPDEDA
jgi:hypothetical protein